MQSNERWISGTHRGIYLKSCCSCYQQYGNWYWNPQNIFSKIKPRVIIALDKTEYTKEQKKKTAEREFSYETIKLKRRNPEKSANIKSPINEVTITDVTQW